ALPIFPFVERLRWFRELAGRMSGLPLRENVRAVVRDRRGRILLLRYEDAYSRWWVTPGGGREPGESDEATLRRELAEEIGLEQFELGPLLWELSHWDHDDPSYGGGSSRVYGVDADAFELRQITEALEARWFELDELTRVATRPRDLKERISSASD